MDLKTRKELEEYIVRGERAESALYIIDTIGKHLIDEIKEEFLKLPILDNQDIDKRGVYVLQLKAEVVKDFQKLVRFYVAKGIEAKKKLNGDAYND